MENTNDPRAIIEKIGTQLSKYRHEQNKTQDDMARILKVGKSYLSSIERGATKCNVKILLGYADILNMSLDTLAGLALNETPKENKFNKIRIIDIGPRLKYFRDNAGVTQSEVSNISELSLNYMQEIERGRYKCNLELLLAYSIKLGVSMDELTGRTGVKTIEIENEIRRKKPAGRPDSMSYIQKKENTWLIDRINELEGVRGKRITRIIKMLLDIENEDTLYKIIQIIHLLE